VLTRLNVGTQKFEIKKNASSQPSIIELNSSVKIEMNGNTYKSHSINLNNEEIIAVLEDCIQLDNISLYYFPRKVIKMPVKQVQLPHHQDHQVIQNQNGLMLMNF
jgi:hypothetical protein